jgi:large subunit ribosomal protein L29
MDVEKIRNLTDAELEHQQRELNDQLFRLKFQLKMGQTESLTKIRGLRKDVARIHTVMREKQLGIAGPSAGNSQPAEASAPAAVPKKKHAAAKPAAAKKTASAAKSAKAKAGKTVKKTKTATAKKRKK